MSQSTNTEGCTFAYLKLIKSISKTAKLGVISTIIYLFLKTPHSLIHPRMKIS